MGKCKYTLTNCREREREIENKIDLFFDRLPLSKLKVLTTPLASVMDSSPSSPKVKASSFPAITSSLNNGRHRRNTRMLPYISTIWEKVMMRERQRERE